MIQVNGSWGADTIALAGRESFLKQKDRLAAVSPKSDQVF
jgi:hypothetical protein